jgi:O-antigen/teichoic acid export membrane protein
VNKKHRLKRLSLALIDQGSFAGFSFVASILLARWMSPEGFGAYSFAFSVFLLVAGVHNVFVIEPLNIFGPSRYRKLIGDYVTVINNVHWLLSGCITVLTLFGTLIMWVVGYRSLLQWSFVGIGLSQGLVLYFWLQRRTQYMKGDIGRAIVGTMMAGVGFLLGIIFLEVAEKLTPFYVFLIFGASSFVAGLFLRFSMPDRKSRSPTLLITRDIVWENLGYGKWLIVSMALHWLTTNAYQVLAGSLLSLSDVGVLRALQNITSPMIQVITAMGLVFMPWLSARYSEAGKVGLIKGIWMFSLAGGGLALTYLIVMWVTAMPLFNLIYANKYASQSWLAPYYCIWPVVPAVTTGLLIGLRVLEKNIEIFKVDLLGAILTVTLGIWLVRQYGIAGAVGGIIMSTCGRIIVLPVIWRYVLKSTDKVIVMSHCVQK